MKRLDASETGIFDIRFGPDGKWVGYVAGDEVRLAEVETQETRIIGKGSSPQLTADNKVIYEKEDEICLAFGGGTKTLFSKADLVKSTPKRKPLLSPDGGALSFVVCNVYDKKSQSLNAYPYRHFLAMSSAAGARARIMGEQWYGGYVSWFPDGKALAHFEFDSTAGPQIHIVRADDGKEEGRLAGLYPSISPDGARIAARPRGGGSVVVYTSKGGWKDDAVSTAVIKMPASEIRRPGATPPLWLDNRLLLVHETDALYRLDTKKEKAEPLGKLPIPTFRRHPSMTLSPDRELIAMEVEENGKFELQVGKLS